MITASRRDIEALAAIVRSALDAVPNDDSSLVTRAAFEAGWDSACRCLEAVAKEAADA